MKRCPRCAEKVQSAARACRFCNHEFEGPDEWGALSDHGGRIVAWIGKALVTALLCYLAYACVRGAAIDQAQRQPGAPGTAIPAQN